MQKRGILTHSVGTLLKLWLISHSNRFPPAVVITDSVFSGNVARSAGGAIMSADNCTVAIRRCMFSNNSAFGASDGNEFHGGGALCVTGKSTLTVDATTIRHNHAVLGGGIILHTRATLHVGDNVTIFNNVADRSGGGGVCLSAQF